jgi:PAS domain S-box-containing protein
LSQTAKVNVIAFYLDVVSAMTLFNQNNLKIAHKGLVITLVPSVIILCFLTVVVFTLDRAEMETKRETRLKKIADDANILDQRLFEAISSVSTYAFTRDAGALQKYDEAVADEKKKFIELRSLIKNPEELNVLSHMEYVNHQMFVLLEEIRQSAIERESEIDMFQIMGLRTRIHSLAQEYNSEALNFKKIDDALQANNPPDPESERAKVKQLAILGALLTVAASLIATWFFSKGVTGRIKVIDDNAHLFAADRPLHSVLSGSDEIADLDRVFHKMAAALKTAARRERAIFDNAVDVICTLDSGNRFREVSGAAAKAWGYSPEDLVGSRLSDIIAAEDLEIMTATQNQLIESGTSASCETRVKRQDETLVDMLWSINWASEEKTFFCVAHDITERKNVERMKTEFLQMISHDVRSPLTAVQGTISLMSSGVFGEFNEKGRITVERAQESVNRIIALVDGLLDLDKLEVGKMQMELEAADLHAVVSRSVHTIAYLAEKQNITITIPTEPLEVLADGPKLIQVVVNLLTNAIKFSPNGSTITVSYKELPGFVELRVKDQGRGIPAKNISSIFERFTQVRSSDHSEKGGKGLGLAICKSIIEAHGGTIGAESTEGQGATFWFTIPQPE